MSSSAILASSVSLPTRSGATYFNATTRKPNYIDRYAEPTTWSFILTTRL